MAAPVLVRLNTALAEDLGLDAAALASPDGIRMLAGNWVPPGAEPIAAAYAGHQFGHFSPQLGDGRAILLGEVARPDGQRRDIQLKGPGRTPWSRGGDGRAALGPVLREYLVSEAMAALGIPTTRALAAVATGEAVLRETALPGAVLTRVAASHIRVGTFQYFAARGDGEAVRMLADHAIARHYPDAANAEHPYRALLAGILARQAELVARWMTVGFVHGVMNTDNTSISGETIDYGPCAFIDAYDPNTVFSSIDQGARYAFANQPRIMHWNLTRLAEAMLPLLDIDDEAAVTIAREILAAFPQTFETAYVGGLRRKVGLFGVECEGDGALLGDLLAAMADGAADFTLTFRRLCDAASDTDADASVRALFADAARYDRWAARWRARLAEEAMTGEARAEAMRRINPAVIARNHLVEEALTAAVDRGDYGPFETLMDVLSRPFEARPGLDRFGAAPGAPAVPYRTFCGT